MKIIRNVLLLLPIVALFSCTQESNQDPLTGEIGRDIIHDQEVFRLEWESMSVELESVEDIETILDSSETSGLGVEPQEVMQNQTANTHFSFSDYLDLSEWFTGEKDLDYHNTRAFAYAILGNREQALAEKAAACEKDREDASCQVRDIYIETYEAMSDTGEEITEGVTLRLVGSSDRTPVYIGTPDRTGAGRKYRINYGTSLPESAFHQDVFLLTSSDESIQGIYTYSDIQWMWQEYDATEGQPNTVIFVGQKPIRPGNIPGDIAFVLLENKIHEVYTYDGNTWQGPFDQLNQYTTVQLGYGTSEPMPASASIYDIYFTTASWFFDGSITSMWLKNHQGTWVESSLENTFIYPSAYRGVSHVDVEPYSSLYDESLFIGRRPADVTIGTQGDIFVQTENGFIYDTIENLYIYDTTRGDWEVVDNLDTINSHLDTSHGTSIHAQVYPDLPTNFIFGKKGYTDFVYEFNGNELIRDIGNINSQLQIHLIKADIEETLEDPDDSFSIQSEFYTFEGSYSDFGYKDGRPVEGQIELFVFDINPDESALAPNLINLRALGSAGNIEGEQMTSFGMPMIRAYVGEDELDILNPIKVTGVLQNLRSLEVQPDFSNVPKNTPLGLKEAREYSIPPFWHYDKDIGSWVESEFEVLNDEGIVQAYLK